MYELAEIKDKITSVEIAELINKEHYNIMQSIRKMEDAWVKIGQLKFQLSSYINSQNRAMPMYVLTKTECLYIATKFNDEARAKLVLRWQTLETQKPMSTLDMVQASIDAIRANEKGLAEVKQDVLELKAATQTQADYFTIVGYATLNKVKVGLHLAAKLGGKAKRICKLHGYQTEQIPDPRFGKVNMYPKSVLQQVFAETVLN